MSANERPADIYPDSGFRLPLPKREDLDAEARALFDYFTDPASGSYAGIRGPGGIRLHSPKVAEYMQPLNRYLRRETGLSGPVRELAILVTAREMESQFEWTAHEPEALKEGIPPATIDVVKHRKSIEGLSETERTIIRLGRQMFAERRVTSDLFADALKLFGRRGLVDLVSLMGQYAATAALLTAFDIQLHPGRKPLLPAR